MQRFRRLLVLVTVCLTVTACGQKGDLYLPEGSFSALKIWQV